MSQCQLGLQAELHRGQPQFLEPIRLQLERLVVGEVAEGPAAPEAQRLPAVRQAGLGLAVRLVGQRQERFEPQGIDVVGIGDQLVGVVDVQDGVRADQVAQVRHVGLQGVVGGGGGRSPHRTSRR